MNNTESLEQMQKDLEIAEKNINNPLISDNPVLKESLERKIKELKKTHQNHPKQQNLHSNQLLKK